MERDYFEKNPIIRDLLDAMGDAVYFCDGGGHIFHMNRAAERLDGYTLDDVRDKTITEVYGLDSESSPLLKVVATGEPIRNHTFRYYANGHDVYQISDVMPLQLADGSHGSASVQKDITMLKRAIDLNIDLQRQMFDPVGDGGAEGRENRLHHFRDLIGEHPSFEYCKTLAKNAARGAAPVLLCGATGSGKELFAQSIHSASSRAEKTFLAINCAAIPETLLEGILFGTKKGAYTGATDKIGLFEQADGGTLFLDEINSMPMSSQSKLLRVLEEKQVLPLGGNHKVPVNTRIISSSNVDPQQAVAQGQLREDLFYRLAVINIRIPSLTERSSDIFLLANHFLSRDNAKYGKRVMAFDDEVLSFFLEFEWPGNVRQLKHTIESAINMVTEKDLFIKKEHLPYYLWDDPPSPVPLRTTPVEAKPSPPATEEDGTQVFASIRAAEKQAIIEALTATGGNVTGAARLLGLTRQTLVYRLKKYNIK